MSIVSNELVAFCVPLSSVGPELSPAAEAALRLLCRQRLPAHMVPSRILALDTLPLTTSGKINRRGLPSDLPPPVVSCKPNTHYILPTSNKDKERKLCAARCISTTEEAVIAAWRAVLNLETDPDLGDRFWDLGGTSATAFAMLRHLEAQLGGGFAASEGAHIRLCGLIRRPRLADYAAFLDSLHHHSLERDSSLLGQDDECAEALLERLAGTLGVIAKFYARPIT